MFNNILVISDNLFICNKLSKILKYKNIENKFSFSTSPFSEKKEFESIMNINFHQYDMRSEKDINIMIEKYDLILSIHCKQLFPKKLVKALRCINVHPGYNPLNRGWYPQVFAIINDLPVGATIHEIDEEIDHGPIIAREFVNKKITDTSLTLYNKILEKELELIDANIISILSNNYKTIIPDNQGVLYLKKDFNKLRELNLSEKITPLELINKLRALTHGDYKNAFFRDPITGKKIYISLKLEEEV